MGQTVFGTSWRGFWSIATAAGDYGIPEPHIVFPNSGTRVYTETRKSIS